MDHQFGFAGTSNSMAAQSSLKTKLNQLEDMVRAVNDDIQYNKRDVQMLRQEKEQLENVLTHKSTEVRKNLQIEAQR